MKVEESKTGGIETIFKSKRKFHKDRAKLPFEEKIKILIQLQQLARDISVNRKERSSSHPMWELK